MTERKTNFDYSGRKFIGPETSSDCSISYSVNEETITIRLRDSEGSFILSGENTIQIQEDIDIIINELTEAKKLAKIAKSQYEDGLNGHFDR